MSTQRIIAADQEIMGTTHSATTGGFTMFAILKRISTIRAFWLALAAFMTLNILYDALNLPQALLRAVGYHGTVAWYAIDNAIGASPRAIEGFLRSYGQAGRGVVIFNHLTFDTLFPLTYMLFFAITLTLIGRTLFRPSGAWRWLTLVPVVAGLCDYLENAGIVTMCLRYPHQSILTIARVTGAFTLLKSSFLGLSIALAVIGGLSLLVRWTIVRARRGTQARLLHA